MDDLSNAIYLGTILLEKNRWPDTPATSYSLGEKLCRGRAAVPTVTISEWAERARADGFDGLELWENHALLAHDEEFERLCHMPQPVAVYSSYFGLDEEDALWREVAAEAVQRLRATGVKYNFGPDPARREVYLRNLRDWVALLDDNVRIICECHKGNLLGADSPEVAAELMAELEDERYQATVHFGYDLAELEQWLRHLGSRVRHVHAGGHAVKGRAFVAERLRLLRAHGFAGSFTIEFTHGVEWGSADPDLETLYANALADLQVLRDALENR